MLVPAAIKKTKKRKNKKTMATQIEDAPMPEAIEDATAPKAKKKRKLFKTMKHALRKRKLFKTMTVAKPEAEKPAVASPAVPKSAVAQKKGRKKKGAWCHEQQQELMKCLPAAARPPAKMKVLPKEAKSYSLQPMFTGTPRTIQVLLLKRAFYVKGPFSSSTPSCITGIVTNKGDVQVGWQENILQTWDQALEVSRLSTS